MISGGIEKTRGMERVNAFKTTVTAKTCLNGMNEHVWMSE